MSRRTHSRNREETWWRRRSCLRVEGRQECPPHHGAALAAMLVLSLVLSATGCRSASTAAVNEDVERLNLGAERAVAQRRTRRQMIEDAKARGDARADKIAFRDWRRFGQHFAEDHRSSAWTQAFDMKHVLLYSVFTGAALGTSAADTRLARHFGGGDRFGDFAHLDTPIALGLPALTMLSLYLHPPDDPALRYDYMAAYSKSLLLTAGVTLGLKGITDRQRPNNDGNSSFPSMHAALTFNAATTLYECYGWKPAVPAYALATFAGLTRMDREKHYASDVVAGAAIGIICAEIVHKWHFGKGGIVERIRWRIIPYADGETAGLLLWKRF